MRENKSYTRALLNVKGVKCLFLLIHPFVSDFLRLQPY